MNIDVTIRQTSDVRHLTKNAPAIARGIFLSADEVELAAGKMLKKARVGQADLSIVFLDGRAMRKLNRQALGHDYVTDVITFDLAGHRTQGTGHKKLKRLVPCALCFVPLEGEIYICPSEAKRNARVYGEPVEREILRYVAHGVLHLLGHDDRTSSDRDKMRKLEDKLLECISV